MTITTISGLVDAMGNRSTLFLINKASLSNQLAGGFTSLWRATGTPAQGAIPAAAAICTSALAGAMSFTNPVDPVRSYISRLFAVSSNSGTDVQVHDRLSHMGGLSGTVTTAQTVNVDVSVATNNMDNRRGDANYSDVQWWLEWYTDTGSTAVTATITYTNAAGTTGRTTTVAMAATMRAGRMLPIIGNGGEFIRSIQSVQLSATTGSAGSFGVTATRVLTGISLGLANAGIVYDWEMVGLPRVHDDACLALVMVPGATTSGTLYGTSKLSQG